MPPTSTAKPSASSGHGLCVYWSADLRGFMGLASHGPNQNCKIGPAADITLRAITAVVDVSPEAVAKWEAAPWR